MRFHERRKLKYTLHALVSVLSRPGKQTHILASPARDVSHDKHRVYTLPPWRLYKRSACADAIVLSTLSVRSSIQKPSEIHTAQAKDAHK